MRALVSRPIIARHRFEDHDGSPKAPDSTPTVAVADGAGTAVTGLGSVTAEADATGVYTVTIPARTQADILKVTWTATIGGATWTEVDYIDVVVTRLLSIRDFREQDAELTTVERDRLARVVESVEDELAGILPYPPFIRSIRTTMTVGTTVPAATTVVAPFGPVYELYFISGDTVGSVTVGDLTAIGWLLTYPNSAAWPAGTYTIHAAYGQAPGADLKAAAVKLARYRSRETTIPERASIVNTPSGTIQLLTPGGRFPTGLPEVDAVLNRYGAGLSLVMA